MQRVLVFGARRYDFKDDDGGRVEGVTLHYLTLDGSEGEENQLGEIPFQCSAPVSMFHHFESSPAMYDVVFKQRPGRGGKPTLHATKVSYAGEASFDGSGSAEV